MPSYISPVAPMPKSTKSFLTILLSFYLLYSNKVAPRYVFEDGREGKAEVLEKNGSRPQCTWQQQALRACFLKGGRGDGGGEKKLRRTSRMS